MRDVDLFIAWLLWFRKHASPAPMYAVTVHVICADYDGFAYGDI